MISNIQSYIPITKIVNFFDMEQKDKEKRAILKGGIYSFLLTLLLLAISVLFSFIDSLFK